MTDTATELRAFVERYERLDLEKNATIEDQKELIAELKSRGYQVKPFRVIIAQRKRDANDLAEEQAIIEMYQAALGM